MNLAHFLDNLEDRLQDVGVRMLTQAEQHQPGLSAVMEPLLASGTARVRPATALLMGDALGAEREQAATLTAAIEMLHTATLVHDDLLDGKLLRRGMPVLNAPWSPAATVLTGDFIFAQAAKLAAETGSVPVMHLFSEALTTVVSGEVMQLFSTKDLAGRNAYYNRIYAKTASMIELSAAAAATISPVHASVVEAARQFGYEIGMAFQIMNDILDFAAGEARTMRALRAGRLSLPAICYAEAHPGDANLRAILPGNGQTPEQVSALVESVRESGALEQALAEAVKFAERGLAALQAFPPSAETGLLAALARHIIAQTV